MDQKGHMGTNVCFHLYHRPYMRQKNVFQTWIKCLMAVLRWHSRKHISSPHFSKCLSFWEVQPGNKQEKHCKFVCNPLCIHNSVFSLQLIWQVTTHLFNSHLQKMISINQILSDRFCFWITCRYTWVICMDAKKNLDTHKQYSSLLFKT